MRGQIPNSQFLRLQVMRNSDASQLAIKAQKGPNGHAGTGASGESSIKTKRVSSSIQFTMHA